MAGWLHGDCATRRKLQTPGNAEEHKRQETPTINPIGPTVGIVWVHADSFLRSVASLFYSFVTTFLVGRLCSHEQHRRARAAGHQEAHARARTGRSA